jgi:hypothetical protein
MANDKAPSKPVPNSTQPINTQWPQLIIAWAWAVVPLAWGVLQTLHKAAALFQN